MFSKSILAATFLITSAFAQSSSAAQAATPAGSVSSAASAISTGAVSNEQQAENLVNYLLPSAVTSLSPAQESKLAVDASNYLVAYTQSHPVSQLEANAIVNQIFGGSTSPSPAQQSSIQDLLNEAGTAALANPSGYVQSVGNLVQPFAFAGAVTSYANGLFDGLRTVVASDLSLSIPTATSQSSTGAAARAAMPTGVVGAAAAAAIGVAGVAMM